MKGKNSTKRALIMSILSIMVCMALLIGSTFAWFSASATNSGNKIEAGTLNISLWQKQADGTYADISANAEPVFNYDKWEPGYTAVQELQLRTTGTLALKYQVSIGGLEALDAATTKNIQNVLDVLVNGTKVGVLANFVSGAQLLNGTLIPAEGKTTADLKIEIHMQETAGNEYQGGVLPRFDIKIEAAQYTYEADGYGSNQYDASALPKFGFSKTVNHVAGTETKVIKEAGLTVTVPDTAATAAVTAVVKTEAITQIAAITTVALDISVTNAAGADVPATIEYSIGKGLVDVKVQHNSVEMSPADYSYDSATGIVTIHCTKYSPFSVTFVVPDDGSDYHAVYIDGVTGLEGVKYDSIDAAYAAFNSALNLTIGSNGDNTYNKIFTGDSITWTIYGSHTISSSIAHPFAGGITQFDGGAGFEISKINVVAGNKYAAIGGATSNFAHADHTNAQAMDISFSGISFIGQVRFHMAYGSMAEMSFNYDNCSFNDQLYFYRNAGKSAINVKNCKFLNPGPVEYAFVVQGLITEINFTGNTLTGYKRGINIQAANADTVISNNTIISTNSLFDRGVIQLTDAKSVVVSGNTVSVNAGNAIWFHSAATNAAVTYSFIDNNITAPYLANDDTTFGADSRITGSGNTLNITYPGMCVEKDAKVATASTITTINK